MKYALGIDLGGTFVKYAVVSEEGEIINEGKVPTKPERDILLIQLSDIAADCVSQADATGIKLEGIGIGTPGIIDPEGKILLGGSPNISDWENIPLADIVEARCGIPVILCNDANAMGLAEQAFGAARGFSDVVFVGVGTGIGGAVIINNRILTGYQNRGAELGCIPIDVSQGSIACACGSRGCWEAYASTSAMLRFYAEKSGEKIDGKELVARFLAREKDAIEVFEQECYYLGRGIAGLINIFAPQKVVIGGGLSEAGSFFADMVSSVALSNAIPDCAVNTQICAAQMGNQAGVVGAAQLILGRI